MRRALWLFAAALAACQFDPYGSEYTRTKPLEASIAGTYVPTQKTLTMMREKGHYPQVQSSIVLRLDGRLILTNIPDWWLDGFGKSKGGFDSGEGRWSLDNAQGFWELILDVDSARNFSSQDHNPRGIGTAIAVINEKPPYLLHLTVGDPDMGDAMQFELKDSRDAG